MAYETTMLKFSQLKYICKNEQISSEAENSLIDNETTMNFQTLLKEETWESVYTDKDPNYLYMFN